MDRSIWITAVDRHSSPSLLYDEEERDTRFAVSRGEIGEFSRPFHVCGMCVCVWPFVVQQLHHMLHTPSASDGALNDSPLSPLFSHWPGRGECECFLLSQFSTSQGPTIEEVDPIFSSRNSLYIQEHDENGFYTFIQDRMLGRLSMTHRCVLKLWSPFFLHVYSSFSIESVQKK